MDKFIVRTELPYMYDAHVDLYHCPKCNEVLYNNKQRWYTEHFARFSCHQCHTWIYVVDKQFKEEDLD